MWRKCNRCDYEISNNYLLKQKNLDEIICPNCGRTLVVTKISKWLASSFFIMISTIFIILPIKIKFKIFIECFWIIFSYTFLPILVFDYNEKE